TIKRVYHYAEASNINGGTACSPAPFGQSNFLTGLTDELSVRYATWTYDCQGRATSSKHAGNVDNYTFTYTSGQATVVDPLSTSRALALSSVLAVPKNTSLTQPSTTGTGNASSSRTFDSNGNLATYVDLNGNR